VGRIRKLHVRSINEPQMKSVNNSNNKFDRLISDDKRTTDESVSNSNNKFDRLISDNNNNKKKF
jgi:hypothetical protein